MIQRESEPSVEKAQIFAHDAESIVARAPPMLGIKRIFRRSAQQKVAAMVSVGYDVPNRPDAAGVRFGRDYDNGLARVSFQLFEYGFEFVGGVVDGRIQGADRGSCGVRRADDHDESASGVVRTDRAA